MTTRAVVHRQKRASELQRSPWSMVALIDHGFFIFAGVASFWLAWLIWREGWHSGGWWMVGLFVVMWALVAYLALPRLHRILSSVYTPNYFIGRTRTADGLLGDPVNVALRGSEKALHQAMIASGWIRAEEITARSVWQMIISTVTGRSYQSAPVSSLLLFGRRQDFAYQQQVDGNPKKRHHVRFWRCPKGWLLPGGHKVDWLAAGTYDKSVGLSLFTFQITHKIDENTDIERDHIVSTLHRHNQHIKVTLLKDFSTGYHSRNGGGDSIKTDGDLPVVELGDMADDRHVAIFDQTLHDHANSQTLVAKLWNKRPPQIFFGSILLGMTVIISLLGVVIDLLGWQTLLRSVQTDLGSGFADWAGLLVIGTVFVSLMIMLLELWLIKLVLAGSERARLMLLALASIVVVVESFSLTIGRMSWSTVGDFVIIGMHLIVLIAFSSDAARRYTSRSSSTHLR